MAAPDVLIVARLGKGIGSNETTSSSSETDIPKPLYAKAISSTTIKNPNSNGDMRLKPESQVIMACQRKFLKNRPQTEKVLSLFAEKVSIKGTEEEQKNYKDKEDVKTSKAGNSAKKDINTMHENNKKQDNATDQSVVRKNNNDLAKTINRMRWIRKTGKITQDNNSNGKDTSTREEKESELAQSPNNSIREADTNQILNMRTNESNERMLKKIWDKEENQNKDKRELLMETNPKAEEDREAVLLDLPLHKFL
ncbi:hypothetical protein HAX54_024015 [Datura stramonium]|uniref:Uncharacterized protein n=1 Tax=Datura stramonium TaxID=4076 RepID=A0ABS8Y5Q4_DATST|nr:hypothetical protein [Datura stramonium]